MAGQLTTWKAGGCQGGVQSALSLASGRRGRGSLGLQLEVWFPTVKLELTPGPSQSHSASAPV